jgi:5-methylcytosine-specific restriction protein A
MVREFQDSEGKQQHDAFLRWRQKYPDGYVLAVRTSDQAKLHRSICGHFGTADYKWYGDGTSETKKLKVCSESLDELKKWISENVYSVSNCPDCLNEAINGADIAPSRGGASKIKTKMSLYEGEGTGFLLTWNPTVWPWDNLEEDLAKLRLNGSLSFDWSCGANKSIKKGDRLFLVRLGVAPKGIIGSGFATSDVFQRSRRGQPPQNRVKFVFDHLFDPSSEGLIGLDELNSTYFQPQKWNPQGSGISIRPDVLLKLEKRWSEFVLNSVIPKTESRNTGWAKDEIEASVATYLEMLRLSHEGSKVPKMQYYRALSKRFGRSEGAYERRMGNISHVMTLMGREWVSGLKPLSNVGSNILKEIQEAIAKLEGSEVDPRLEFEAKASELVKKRTLPKPKGSLEPTKTVASQTVYTRDVAVKAWVEREAKGVCESCASEAPFKTPNGDPFLEVHHVKRLCEGGSDRIENAVALCPNCHRAFHHSAHRDRLVAEIYRKVKRLERE